jgi:hypothetical protein
MKKFLLGLFFSFLLGSFSSASVLAFDTGGFASTEPTWSGGCVFIADGSGIWNSDGGTQNKVCSVSLDGNGLDYFISITGLGGAVIPASQIIWQSVVTNVNGISDILTPEIFVGMTEEIIAILIVIIPISILLFAIGTAVTTSKKVLTDFSWVEEKKGYDDLIAENERLSNHIDAIDNAWSTGKNEQEQEAIDRLRH